MAKLCNLFAKSKFEHVSPAAWKTRSTSDLLLVGIEIACSMVQPVWSALESFEIKDSEPNMIWGCLFLVFFTVKHFAIMQAVAAV